MLPRCARAIETGYCVFTMDLIWGHRLGNRRETQMYRVFKYANRGFGLRILSSYARSLEKKNYPSDHESSSTKGANVRRGPTRIFNNEPGLKTLRRIARLAQNFVHRIHFGPSKRIDFEEDVRIDEDIQFDEKMQFVVNQERRGGLGAYVCLPTLNDTNTAAGIPDARNSLGVFEIFMRHCAAWRLDAIGLAK